MWNIRCQFRTCPPFYVWLNLVEFWSILWFLLLLNGRLHGMSFLALKSDVPEGPWDQPGETQGHRGSHCKLTHWKSKINESPDVYQHCQQESQNTFEAFYLNLELVSNLGVKLISAAVHFVSQHNDGICGFPASIATSTLAIAIKGPKHVARRTSESIAGWSWAALRVTRLPVRVEASNNHSWVIIETIETIETWVLGVKNSA